MRQYGRVNTFYIHPSPLKPALQYHQFEDAARVIVSPAHNLCTGKANALDSRSYLSPSSTALRGVFYCPLLPHSVYSLVPSNFDGSPGSVGSGLGEILIPQ